MFPPLADSCMNISTLGVPVIGHRDPGHRRHPAGIIVGGINGVQVWQR